ncbi:hypothetical protein HYW41_00415 [Candidatus Daviesbacteria bacterium]|nr:hypothetical protein [Candidatus Daviesbacteria bacterium]
MTEQQGLTSGERIALIRSWVERHPESEPDIAGDVAATAYLTSTFRFGHLTILTSSYGGLTSPREMNDHAVRSLLETGDTQYCVIIGPQGTGKTLTFAQGIDDFDEHVEAVGKEAKKIQSTIVTIQDALWAGQRLPRADGSFFVSPKHSSNPADLSKLWDERDFLGGTRILTNALYMAGVDYNFVFAEIPCIGGYRMTDRWGRTKITGKDRGTSAVCDLSTHQGVFANSRSKLWVTAMTALPGQYKRNLESRAIDSRTPERPGGNVLATEIGNMELEEFIRDYSTASGDELPDLSQELDLVSIDAARLFIWRSFGIPWLLGPENFNVPPEQVLVCENSRPGLPASPRQIEEFRRRSYIYNLHDHQPDKFLTLAQ